ncbi:MAG: NAD(P)/FAD-dependent oxidoreductase [Pseudomonadota bacterium]
MAEQSAPLLDCLVVGAGPAGLTAGLYLRRFHRRVTVVDGGDARALRIPRSHNVPGFPQGIPGPELLQRLREQFAQAGGQVTPGRVGRLERLEDGRFVAHLDGGAPLHARTVLLATGARDREPELPALDALRRGGLLRQCPICDGFEFTGRRIAVIGAGAHGVRECLFIRRYSESLCYIALGGDEQIEPELAQSLHEAGVACIGRRVRDARPLPEGGVVLTLDSGRTQHFDVVYAALGCHPRAELGTRLGARLDEGGNLVIDGHGRTGIAGLYAAGDVTGGLDQIVVAAGQAAIAATAIHNSLRGGRP